MKRIMIALAVAAPLLLAGAAFAQHERGAPDKRPAKTEAAKQKKEAAEPRKVAAEEVGKEAVCPVTGEKLKVAENTVSMSYKGKVYYFCCPGCDKKFAADPEKYAVKKPAAAAKYVCPMGDYEGAKPGKCPKCGMTLQKK